MPDTTRVLWDSLVRAARRFDALHAAGVQPGLPDPADRR